MKIFPVKQLFTAVILLLFTSACKDYVEIDPPINNLVASTAFDTESDIRANIAGMHSYNLLQSSYHDVYSHFYKGFAANEILYYTANEAIDQYITNSILPSNTVNRYHWSEPYKFIYQSNLMISALDKKTGISETLKNEALGTAHYFRAYSYLNLASQFGDVPLVLTTDVKVSGSLPRTPKAEVYKQVIADLITAKTLLKDIGKSYSWASEPAASALLARTYLYNEQWQDAAKEAALFVTGTWAGKYKLESIPKVFKRGSTETIFAISSDGGNRTVANYTYAGVRYVPATSVRVLYPLTDHLLNSFEKDDLRKTNWVKQFTAREPYAWYAYKYKLISTPSSSADAEDQVLIRLAEIYFIFAEANAQLGNNTEAITTLNAIRTRAGLAGLSPSLDKNEILLAIEKERQVELFLEYGHRWIDLVRTGRADAVLGSEKPASWKSYSKLFPVPEQDILLNPFLSQNPGYNATL